MNDSAAGEHRAAAATAPWRLRLLGAFELDDGRTRLRRLPSSAALRLLASLALDEAREHAREELIERLWPGVDPASGRARLRQTLSTLRRLLETPASGAVIVAGRRALRLLPGALDCDVAAFRRAAASGRVAEARALYRGELLPGLDDDWIAEERQRLAEIAAGSSGESVASAAGPATAVRLPVFPTRLLGVAAVAARLAGEVRGARLVTLRGPGGAGKTRLAVQVARALAEATDRPFDLVQFVPLADCRSAVAMADAILLALRQEGGDGRQPFERIAAALAARRVLLVLDNVEQLVDDARDAVAGLAAALPSLHLLVTSRRALAIDGEYELELPRLALPGPRAGLAEAAASPAVALFVERARAARADFQLGARNHGAVAEVVRRLEGLPLAIELAAAQVRSLAPAEMLARLDGAGALHWLASRSAGARDGRHASMRRVLDWSHALLSAGQQALLVALAAFHGGAPAAALGQGAALVADLDALIASSVLRAEAGPDGRTRFLLAEAVREYALAEAGPARAAAARAGQRRAMRAWAEALPPAPPLDAFRVEIPNLVGAIESALDDGAAAEAAALALACRAALVEVTLPPHALLLLEGAAEQHPSAALHALLAEQCFDSGRGEAALAHAEAVLALAPPDAGADSEAPPDGAPADAARADPLRAAARVLLRVRNDTGRAAALIARALPLARGWPEFEAPLLSLQAVIATRCEHDFVRAEALHRAALGAWERSGSPLRSTIGRVNLAIHLGFRHAIDEQLALLVPALAAAEAQGQWRLAMFSRSVLGTVLANLRRWDESAASARECLRQAWDLAAWREWFYGLWNLPRTLAHQRRPLEAARLMGFADRFYAERFGRLGWEDLRERRRTRRLVRVQIGAAALESAWDEGFALDPTAAMRLAMEGAPAPTRSP